MDVDTGKIRKIPYGEKPKDSEILVDKIPNPNCGDCHGRGVITRIVPAKKTKSPCHCLAKSKERRQSIEDAYAAKVNAKRPPKSTV